MLKVFDMNKKDILIGLRPNKIKYLLSSFYK